ncbi:MAG: hypothetical protein QXO32_06710 [Candidatus Bathyarchaeia archaeon]
MIQLVQEAIILLDLTAGPEPFTNLTMFSITEASAINRRLNLPPAP